MENTNFDIDFIASRLAGAQRDYRRARRGLNKARRHGGAEEVAYYENMLKATRRRLTMARRCYERAINRKTKTGATCHEHKRRDRPSADDIPCDVEAARTGEHPLGIGRVA